MTTNAPFALHEYTMPTIYPPYVIERSPRGERSYDIFSRLLMDRIIFLGTPVNDDVANIVIAPSVTPGTVVTTEVSHYGALRATEEMLGLPLLRSAAQAGAQDLRPAFGI